MVDIKRLIDEVSAQVGGFMPTAYVNDAVSISEIPSKLEHSLLNPDITENKIREECAKARRYGVAAVCVAPYYVGVIRECLAGSTVKVGTAIGFPHGCLSTASKVAEAKECIENGANEIDVSLNILAIKSQNMADARKDLETVLDVCRGKALVKVVFEHAVYSDDEKIAVLNMIRTCGAEFVKIQNVLSGKGADANDIRFAKEILGNNVGIKIDGGVKTLAKAEELILAGADRIGLTATIEIAKEALLK